ncbi:hypothetical protein MY11210_005128 [Beauveria gryllotalpidicola]
MSDKASSSKTEATSASSDVEIGTASMVPVYGYPLTGAAAKQLSSSGKEAQRARAGTSVPRPPTPPRGSTSDKK